MYRQRQKQTDMKKQHIPFLLFAVLAGVMAVTTVVEKFLGTPFIMRHVYGSVAFVLLWAVAAGAGVWLVARRRMWRWPATFLLHVALLVILLGGAVTRLTGERGTVHLRQGEPPVSMFALDGGGGARLPFALSLEQFQLQYYTGSMAPMDFVSTLAVTDGDTQRRGTVSMNRVFTHRHYRFYQSAYDGDGRGTTLAVSHDPWGIGVTYVGYALLLAAMGAFFFQRGSAFRRLWHHPALRGGASVLFVLLGANVSHASDALPTIKNKYWTTATRRDIILSEKIETGGNFSWNRTKNWWRIFFASGRRRARQKFWRKPRGRICSRSCQHSPTRRQTWIGRIKRAVPPRR